MTKLFFTIIATFLLIPRSNSADELQNIKLTKVVILGDSISSGVGASNPTNRYTTRVLEALNKTNTKFKQVNLAISGSSLVDTAWPHNGASAYPHLIQKTIEEQPGILLIQHGTNDDTLGHSAGEFLWAFRQTVREIKQSSPQTRIVCMTVCPAWDVERCDNQWLQRINVGIQEIAAREQTLLAQTYLKLRHRKELFPDGVHPNDEGHAIMAQSVLEALTRQNHQAVTNFEFTVRGPGHYRLCGYEINVLAPKGEHDDGWVEIYGLGQKSFDYRSDYDVEILTPFRLCGKNFEVKVTRGDNRPLILKGECHPHFGYGKLLLPPTRGLTNRVVIAE